MNLSVDFAGVEMKNPVTTASGTFGSGAEFAEFVDLNELGAVTTKGVANGKEIPHQEYVKPMAACLMRSVYRIRELMYLQKETFLF